MTSINAANLFFFFCILLNCLLQISSTPFSFKKIFKTPRENYEDRVARLDKQEILERSDYSSEDVAQTGNDIDNRNKPLSTATAQINVRFGGDMKTNPSDPRKHVLVPVPIAYPCCFLPYTFLPYGGGTVNPGHHCPLDKPPQKEQTDTEWMEPSATHQDNAPIKRRTNIQVAHVSAEDGACPVEQEISPPVDCNNCCCCCCKTPKDEYLTDETNEIKLAPSEGDSGYPSVADGYNGCLEPENTSCTLTPPLCQEFQDSVPWCRPRSSQATANGFQVVQKNDYSSRDILCSIVEPEVTS